MRRDPAPPGILLLARIDDTDDRSIVGEDETEVAASPDVADERLDGDGRRERPARERFEAGGVGREQDR